MIGFLVEQRLISPLNPLLVTLCKLSQSTGLTGQSTNDWRWVSRSKRWSIGRMRHGGNLNSRYSRDEAFEKRTRHELQK